MSLSSALARILAPLGAGLLILAPLDAAVSASAAAAPSGTQWVTKPLPAAAGTGLGRNQDGEPGLGVTPTGQLWTASDIAPYAAGDPRVDPAAGLLSGADVWTSTDGGRTYKWLSDPFAEAANSPGLAGEDTDLAVANAKNSDGFYNVYVTSLWVGASGLAWSSDGGKTWKLNRLGGVPTQDRPWLAADGACTVYLGFHQLPSFTPVFATYDVCSNGDVPVGGGAAIDPVNETLLSLSDFPGLSGSFNKFVVDTSPTSKWQHSIYQPMSLCRVQGPTDLLTNATASSGCPVGTQYLLAVSRDGGQTFSYHPVVNDPSGATLVWAATVATDAAGTVYFTWSDSKNSYLDVSRDGGVTWSKSMQLNAPHTAAVYPTVAGGKAGRVDVAWYGTTRGGDSNDAKVMGKPNATGAAPWRVYVARSTNSGGTFSTRAVSAPVHRGELCTHGSGCSDTDSRNLLDDFGLVISPTTGLDSVVFTDDQPQGHGATAYTAYASEVAPTTTRHTSHSPKTGATGASSGPSLAATGGTLAPAAAGITLLGAAALLRRRQRSA